MRGAILPLAATLALAGCATPPATTAAALQTQQADYSQLSCSQLAAELARTQRAYFSASKRERQSRGGGTAAQAFLLPASLGPAPPAASASLLARLENLRRASRAKRCSSTMSKVSTA
jgi:hypothetical protein